MKGLIACSKKVVPEGKPARDGFFDQRTFFVYPNAYVIMSISGSFSGGVPHWRRGL